MAAKSRRKAREAALQVLYQVEIGRLPAEGVLQTTLEEAALDPELARFASELVHGVRAHQAEIDDLLAARITEWDFDRIAAVERNILRVACYELLHQAGIPPAVTINEAVDIAKRFATLESGKFVNGVLGRVLRDSPKADWDPATAPSEWNESPAAPAEEPEIEEVDVLPDEAAKLSRIGGWKIKTEENPE